MEPNKLVPRNWNCNVLVCSYCLMLLNQSYYSKDAEYTKLLEVPKINNKGSYIILQ